MDKLEEIFLKIIKKSKIVPKMTLNKNLKNFTSDFGISLRKVIRPSIQKLLMTKTDRNVLNPKKINASKEDTIMFVSSHSIEQDLIATYVTVDRNFYTVMGTIEQIKNYPKIFFAWLHGLIVVDRHNKESKKTINEKQVRVHNKGTSTLICAEATYNNSENLPIEKIFSGFYRAANLSNENVKVVVVTHFADYNYKDYYKQEYYNEKGELIKFEELENIIKNYTINDINNGKIINNFYNKYGESIDITDLAYSILEKEKSNDCYTRYSDVIDIQQFFDKNSEVSYVNYLSKNNKEIPNIDYTVYYDKNNNKLNYYKLLTDINNYNELNKDGYLSTGEKVNILNYTKKRKANDKIIYDTDGNEILLDETKEIIKNYKKAYKTYTYLSQTFDNNFDKFVTYLNDVNKKEKIKMPLITAYVRDVMATEMYTSFESYTRPITRKNLPLNARRQFFRSRYDEYMRVKWTSLEKLIEELIYYEGTNPDLELLARRKELYNSFIDFWIEDFPEDNIDIEKLKKKIEYYPYMPSNKDELIQAKISNTELVRTRK